MALDILENMEEATLMQRVDRPPVTTLLGFLCNRHKLETPSLHTEALPRKISRSIYIGVTFIHFPCQNFVGFSGPEASSKPDIVSFNAATCHCLEFRCLATKRSVADEKSCQGNERLREGRAMASCIGSV